MVMARYSRNEGLDGGAFPVSLRTLFGAARQDNRGVQNAGTERPGGNVVLDGGSFPSLSEPNAGHAPQASTPGLRTHAYDVPYLLRTLGPWFQQRLAGISRTKIRS